MCGWCIFQRIFKSRFFHPTAYITYNTGQKCHTSALETDIIRIMIQLFAKQVKLLVLATSVKIQKGDYENLHVA